MLLNIVHPCLAFLRFAVNGAGVALIAALTYMVCAVALGIEPLRANLVAYIVQLAVGYHIHRVYSFGQRHTDAASIFRYLALSISAFLLNSLWVWLATSVFDFDAWTPILPMVLLTPLVTFIVGRRWVFKAS